MNEYILIESIFFRKVQKALFQYAWVIATFLFSAITYEMTLASIYKESSDLIAYKNILIHKKEIAESIREDLLLQIKAQNDPLWIEIALMRGIGVKRDKYTKVYFFDE